MEHLSLTVTGMTCGGCENAVRRAVGALTGVGNVTASHQKNRVDIEYDPAQTDREAIARAIQTVGFAVQ